MNCAHCSKPLPPRKQKYCCPNCNKAAWKKRHPENRIEYYTKNKEDIKAKSRAWGKANAKRKQARNREWWKKNPQMARATTRRWREKNPEKMQKCREDWKAQNPEKNAELIKRCTARRSAAIAKCPPEERKAIEKWRRSWRRKVSVVCHWCGASGHPSTYNSYHIIPIAKDGEHSLLNLCIACEKCNMAKGTSMPIDWNPLLAQPVLL